jgi:hypothetical protein
MLPRLQLKLPGSSDSASASGVDGIAGVHHHHDCNPDLNPHHKTIRAFYDIVENLKSIRTKELLIF